MTASDTSSGLAAIVGGNIRRGRIAAGLTQSQVAREIGASDSMAVSRWERGLHSPSNEHVIALAELLFEGQVAALYTPIPETKDAA